MPPAMGDDDKMVIDFPEKAVTPAKEEVIAELN